MYRKAGYVNAYTIRDNFGFHSLEPHTQKQLTTTIKCEILYEKRLKLLNGGRKVSLDFTRNEAEQEIADCEITRQRKDRKCFGAFNQFLSKCELYLVTPERMPLPVDNSLRAFHYFSDRLAVREIQEGPGTTRRAISIPENVRIPWSFIGGPYLTIHCRARAETFALAKRVAQDLDSVSISPPLARVFTEMSSLEPIARQLSTFEGAVLAVREDQVPSAAEITKRVTKSFAGKLQLGRPRKQDIAASVYWELFPAGHANLTMKMVLRDIEQHSGLRVTRNTLLDALRNTQ